MTVPFYETRTGGFVPAFLCWPITLFGVELRGPTAAPIEWLTAPANLLHGKLAWLLLALIVGHVAMALIHQFVWRDGKLGLMAGRRGVTRR